MNIKWNKRLCRNVLKRTGQNTSISDTEIRVYEGDHVEAFGIVILIINVFIVGFVIWTVSSINEKLELLIRIQLKNANIHFKDKNMEEEIEKYRDK